MTKYILKMVLESDAAFGRGDGVVGLVDAEVQHDEMVFQRAGAQGLAGSGMRRYPCFLALRKSSWEQSAWRLFGRPGSSLVDNAVMVVGNAFTR